ncbi:MAG: non-canonical purine NTP pyrophosphatase [Solirubrobacteraceae bacterium]|nr:non-canonical purine NTP pyrophosphatase [Solirubrobacteraceae bacterium]
MQFVLSTRNAHKVRELQALLHEHELLALPDDVSLPPEDAPDFVGNALTKARSACSALGIAAIADDSGLEAHALGGAPGVRSARYAGEHATDGDNLRKLIQEAPAGSALAYVCAIAVVLPDGTEGTVEGRCTGVMADTPRGDGGFGYDPVFIADDDPHGRTMAELTDAEKGAISHRGRAVAQLRALIERLPAP